jgi:NDP-sugar pyrophosphorylase family protein
MSRDPLSVRGVVLAGTYHWGESPFEQLLRGPLLPLAQMPLISYPLRWLATGGVQHVTVCANSSTAAVRDRLGEGKSLGLQLNYYADSVPRGAAGCVRDAGWHTSATTFVVVEGALIPSLDLRAALDVHEGSGAAATVIVEVDRRRNSVTGERPRRPGGIYLFDRSVLEEIPAHGFQDIKESLLERLYRAGKRVHSYEVMGVTPRVLSYETYVAVNAWLIQKKIDQGGEGNDYVRVEEGLRHVSALVHPRARIVGPVLIGPEARVLPGAVIVGPTTIGARCVVEQNAVVTRSILWDGCTVAAGAAVDGSLLTDGVAVPQGEQHAGAVCLSDESERTRGQTWMRVPTLRTRRGELPTISFRTS